MSDEELFGQATREFSSGMLDRDLQAKARVIAGGDGTRTEFEYIKLRVDQLKSDRRTQRVTAASDSARRKLASGGRDLRSFFLRGARKYGIGIAATCVLGIGAAVFLTNEVSGACDRFRSAKNTHMEWVAWATQRKVELRDMRVAPYGVLAEKYGTDVADSRRNFQASSNKLRTAQGGLNFTGFCFSG